MNRFRFGFLFLFFALLFAGCGKDDDNNQPQPKNNGTNANNGQMTALINGVVWSADLPYAELRNKYELQISGLDLNGVMLAVSSVNVLKPGKFDAFSYRAVTGWDIETKNGATTTWTSLSSNDCQLNITKLDWANKRISGTFAFAADSQASSSQSGYRTITNGIFTDVPINVNTPVPTSTMTALVNNAAWEASGMFLVYDQIGNDYSLVSSDVNGHSIHLDQMPSLSPGTYTTGYGELDIPFNQDFQGWASSFNSNFTYTITNYDPVAKVASGTFSFAADAIGMNGETGTKIISQGNFTNVPVF